MLFVFTQAVKASGADNDTVFEETELMFIGEDLYTVSIASRKAEPLQRAPAAVTVIQAEELKKCRTLSEALRRVPGFFIDRNELKERIYLRGIPDSFLVMMDGVPFSSDASTIDYPRGMELSPDYIEKIEIIRGPGSALWGPDAFSGIINLVTKKGDQLQGLQIKGETGSYDTRGATLQGGFAKKGWDGFLFGAFSHTEGFEKDLPDKRRRDDRYGEIYGRLSYKDVLEISGRYSRYRDYYTEPNYLLESSERKSFSFVQTTLNKSFENSSFSLQGWFQYFDSLDDYDRSRYEQINRQYGAEIKYDQTLFGNNFATLGASFRYNDGSKTKLKYRDMTFDYFPSYHTHLVSYYFQNKWKITDNLETTFGIRYDNHSEYRNFYSPRVGINYIFWDYFNIKLLYGRAFRTPSLAVVIEESGLDPEQIDSYEVELGFHYKNIFNIEVNYFYNELDDIIERDALGEITNKGDENIKGIEVSLTCQPHNSLSFYANYSHLLGDRQRGARSIQRIPSKQDPDETIESTIESFFNVAPDNVWNFGIDYSFLEHFRLNLEMNYVDRRKLARGGQEFYGGRRHVTSYVLFDVNLFVMDFPLKNTEMALKIKNITDKKYNTRGVFGLVEGEGSSMYFTLSYRF
jgi:outer membrane receptor protein involved in Fe transport